MSCTTRACVMLLQRVQSLPIWARCSPEVHWRCCRVDLCVWRLPCVKRLQARDALIAWQHCLLCCCCRLGQALAVLEQRQGNTDEARRLLEESVNQNPKHVQSWQVGGPVDSDATNKPHQRAVPACHGADVTMSAWSACRNPGYGFCCRACPCKQCTQTVFCFSAD